MGSVVADLETNQDVDRDRLSNGPAWVLLIAAIVLGLLAGAVAWRDGAEIERNQAFTLRLERLLSGLKDLETGQRGFLLTGDEAYLEPYRSGEPLVERQLSALRDLDLPLDGLVALVQERRASLARAIDAYRTSGSAAALAIVQQGRGKALMDAIHAGVQDREADADGRIADLRRREAMLAVPLGVASSLGLAAAFALLIRATVRRRRAQMASAALLEGVLDNAPIGLGFLDATLRLRRVNRALQDLGAHPQMVGRSVWEALPRFRAALEPRLRDVMAGTGMVRDLEVLLPDADGSGGVQAFQVSAYALKQGLDGGAAAEVVGAGLVVLDRTEQKRGETRLRVSEQRFRTLTESVSSMIWVTDGEGRFVTPQAEWSSFTGQAFDIHRGWGWQAAVHPDDLEATVKAWSDAAAAGTPYRIEHRVRRADGTWRYVAAAAVPILDEAGVAREWIGSHTDITERKEAELELEAAKAGAEAANRAKSVFLANMSHELRTPLSAVIGYSEMMEEDVEDLGIETLATDLGKIKSNARHLLSLINDVLDLSKIEANRMDVLIEEVEVAPLLAEVAATVTSLIAKKNNTLVHEPAASLGRIRTDVVKLRQCLFNLLSNAAKFTENGRIALSARRLDGPGGDLEVRVADSGIGMSPDQVAKLFQRFSQADETTTRKFGGTGLGLAITQAFSRLLGGDIRVESQLGTGSTFILRIPAVMPEPAAVPGADEGGAAAPQAGGYGTVLVIDADAAQRELMARFLERQGFAVRAAADGRTGIAMARELRPRAILLDVMMPQMDGWSVLGALKADADLAPIPVVMVTFVHDTGLGASLGAADYLSKPVHWDKLKAVMDRFRMAEGDVLIVDDDIDARSRLATMLGRNGWTIREAGDGREALDIVAHAVPRVILLDLTMPVMDGFSFLEALRERPGCAEVPVIVLTARDLTAADRHRLDSAERVFAKGGVSLSEIAREIRAVAVPAAEPERAAEPSL